MKKVMVFGSFDVIHPGHIHFLKEAKGFGDFLVIVAAKDSTIAGVKGRRPKYSESERISQLAKLKIADVVEMGGSGDKYKIIEKHRPDVICLGYDQRAFTQNLAEELDKRKIKSDIIRLKPYREDIYKSSKLR